MKDCQVEYVTEDGHHQGEVISTISCPNSTFRIIEKVFSGNDHADALEKSDRHRMGTEGICRSMDDCLLNQEKQRRRIVVEWQ